MAFQQDFIWGAATSSYQIEGAAQADGKGTSIWDTYCEQPGRILDGSSGEVACDHYHRYAEDVDLMADIGLRGYRFSLSWPRIMPEGTGAVNEAGLDFYDRLVDALLAKGIQPFATLYHWDLPQTLFSQGGWMNPASPGWFEQYAAAVAKRLGDRVRNWFTLNEPQCFIGLGLWSGDQAPGLKMGWNDILLAAHHALLAHGLSVQAIREHAARPPKIGAAPTGTPMIPATNTARNIEVAYEATFSVPEPTTWNFSWYTDPIFQGHYPEDGLRIFGNDVPKYSDRDMAVIHQPLDFCGLNIYHGRQIAEDGTKLERPAGFPLTAMKWPLTPEALYWGPRFFHQRYGLPIYITENGCSMNDWIDADGRVPDFQRIDYHRRYLRAYRRAAAEGIPLLGYFLWSFMDNFEWSKGYTERFGLIHVDFQTLQRTPKASANWYREVIASNGENL